MLNHYIAKIDDRKSRHLTKDQILYIKRKAASSYIYNTDRFDCGMAKLFKVGRLSIKNVREGKTYKDIK